MGNVPVCRLTMEKIGLAYSGQPESWSAVTDTRRASGINPSWNTTKSSNCIRRWRISIAGSGLRWTGHVWILRLSTDPPPMQRVRRQLGSVFTYCAASTNYHTRDPLQLGFPVG